ncbi:winged helix DNA-binding domain-containing protein [Allorhizocola rhizosphaerae]|uniref:winged helix DNA-binding domain-containing protein n=1 Tax=Allorhizocola rhizosphaerae TaxID=1872709 RepID=UPI000E3DF8D7|nr:winged helix DNA-binding domain-containing protein [Allorhizocola rhizosphaerae]
MITLSQRILNRTLLQRQYLLSRVAETPLDTIRHLVAMQAQFPNGPYIGLWSRLEGFTRDALTALITDRVVVRSTMMRRTQHLAAGDDFVWLRPSVEPVITVALKHPFYAKEIEGLDPYKVAAVGRDILGDQALPRRAFGKLLGERFPGHHSGRLADTVELVEPMVHTPPASLWGPSRHPAEITVALAASWLGRPMLKAQLHELALRYLASFGPASVMDLQAWSGLTRLREVVEGLDLRVYKSESGTKLYDLPDAPLATGDEPAPVRFLPAFDNALQGHKDRTRVISEDDRQRIARGASGGVPMFVVNGFVAGTWSYSDGDLHLDPFRPLSKSERSAVDEEAAHLLAFLSR